MNGCVAVAPQTKHTHTIIFLHGRGSTAKEFRSELFESESDGRTLPELYPQLKWIFPNAPVLPVARFGEVMPQWFDMCKISLSSSPRVKRKSDEKTSADCFTTQGSTDHPHEREDEQLEGIENVISNCVHMIAAEAPLVGGPQNIILAGISQGCAVAIHALLSHGSQLGLYKSTDHRSWTESHLFVLIGGFLGLSSWIPNRESLKRTANDAQRTPIFLSHSEDDGVIAIKYGEELRDHLKGLGMVIEWHAYEDGGHWVHEPNGVGDMVAFLNRILVDADEVVLKSTLIIQ